MDSLVLEIQFTVDETGWPHIVNMQPNIELSGALVEETGKSLEELRRAMLLRSTITQPPEFAGEEEPEMDKEEE